MSLVLIREPKFVGRKKSKRKGGAKEEEEEACWLSSCCCLRFGSPDRLVRSGGEVKEGNLVEN